MPPPELVELETDVRFPSGPWTGFYIQPWMPGRHTMTLDLTFRDGTLTSNGSDRVGPFNFSGSYDPEDGKCHWTKKYLRKHSVSYAGMNEGKGIWGVWEIRLLGGLYHDRGVFHIWPNGMSPDAEADRTERALLDSVSGRPPFVILSGVIGFGLLIALYILVRLFARQWIEGLFE